jgi:hypothetical protein
MIAITRFEVNPDPASCGGTSTIEVDVDWAGPASKTVEVQVDVPEPCQFLGPLQERKTGKPKLEFRFTGSFDCPRTRVLILKATAHEVGGGGDDQADCRVTVRC